MKAKLRPLNGKYYGTEIEIDFQDGSDKEVIKFWNTDGFEPSIREISDCDDEESIKEIMCDSHFESKLTYERACKVIDAINTYKGGQEL